MSDIFRPYEKLVEISIMGKTFLVPERNSLLRAFQFISPETIPYGRFCWNQDCQYCKVSCQLSDEDQSRPILSCKFLVSEGMAISDLAPELIGCLRTKLGAAAPPAQPLWKKTRIRRSSKRSLSHTYTVSRFYSSVRRESQQLLF